MWLDACVCLCGMLTLVNGVPRGATVSTECNWAESSQAGDQPASFLDFVCAVFSLFMSMRVSFAMHVFICLFVSFCISCFISASLHICMYVMLIVYTCMSMHVCTYVFRYFLASFLVCLFLCVCMCCPSFVIVSCIS